MLQSLSSYSYICSLSASIGSNNLDPLSWAYNTETKIVAYDKEIAARLNAQFEKDKKKVHIPPSLPCLSVGMMSCFFLADSASYMMD